MESHLPSTNKCSASQTSSTEPDRDAKFLAMLPRIRRQAGYYLRRVSHGGASRCRCRKSWPAVLSTYLRLIERGKADLAFAGPLARYAACQYLRGRRVGSRMNARDVTSDYCRRRKEIWSSNSIASTTRPANGNSWSWKTNIPRQLTLRQQE